MVIFDSKHKLAPFLTSILNTEVCFMTSQKLCVEYASLNHAQVEAADSGRVDTLFRGNSMACKVLSSSFKTFGLYYLQSVVRPLILQMLKLSDVDFEVDPARMTDPSKLAVNQANLLELVQTFCNTIVTSIPSVPLQLRTVCHVLFSVCASVCLCIYFVMLHALMFCMSSGCGTAFSWWCS